MMRVVQGLHFCAIFPDIRRGKRTELWQRFHMDDFQYFTEEQLDRIVDRFRELIRSGVDVRSAATLGIAGAHLMLTRSYKERRMLPPAKPPSNG